MTDEHPAAWRAGGEDGPYVCTLSVRHSASHVTSIYPPAFFGGGALDLEGVLSRGWLHQSNSSPALSPAVTCSHNPRLPLHV